MVTLLQRTKPATALTTGLVFQAALPLPKVRICAVVSQQLIEKWSQKPPQTRGQIPKHLFNRIGQGLHVLRVIIYS